MNWIVAILSGIICGLAIWFLGFMVFNSLHPYPIDIDLSSRESFQHFVYTLPDKAFILKIVFNCLAVFVSGLVASIVSKRGRYQSGVIAVLPFIIYYVVHDFTYTYPTFFVVCDISIAIIMGFIAIMYGGSRSISD